MSTFIAEKTVTARKDHACMLCGQVAVVKGASYTYSTWVFDGRVYNWVDCTPCGVVIREAINDGYETDEGGVDVDTADEWARESRATSETARAYLIRRGYTEEDGNEH